MLSNSLKDPPTHVVPCSVVKPSELGGAAAVTGVQAVHPSAEPAASALKATAGAKCTLASGGSCVGPGGNPSQPAEACPVGLNSNSFRKNWWVGKAPHDITLCTVFLNDASLDYTLEQSPQVVLLLSMPL